MKIDADGWLCAALDGRHCWPAAVAEDYLLDGRPVEREDVPKVTLGKALADWRAGKEDSGCYTLQAELWVEAKIGVTATEEQIALARETIKAAGVNKPEAKP
ncbi:MAG TPA: hypothetical protein PK280_08265 [Planctomycetota bacterium]|nr:hypothetical protein [Planctomycetota bacterium]